MEETFLAAAKVNLGLRIVGRRPDGFHLLESCMTPITLYDTVRIRCEPGSGLSVYADDPCLPIDKRNLAWGAAVMALGLGRVSARVEISLGKRIPAGAGLGGGSADAAAVLTGLNAMLGLGLSARRLAEAGARLGADVPFFVRGKPAIVSGIGERVRAIPAFRRRWLVVAWPGFPILTQWLYRRFDRSLTKTKPAPMIRRSTKRPRSFREGLANDLEAVAVAAYPELLALKERVLQLGAQRSLMTGSGSAFVGLFSDREMARRAAAALRRAGIWAEAVHTIEHVPPMHAR